MTRQIKTLVWLGASLLISISSFAQDPPLPPGHNARLVVVHVFLEGFFDPAQGLMQRAQYWDETNQQLSDRFAAPIAERITIQLRDKTDYSVIVTQDTQVNLLATGEAAFYLSSVLYNDEYYITVISRNHLETTTDAPVSFAGTDPVVYGFTDAAHKAYGSNQALLAPGVYGLFAGDINQDGMIDATDRSLVQSQLINITMGYVVEDSDGNGTVNASDRSVLQSNLIQIVVKQTP